jgi:hypothetical protein
MKDKVAGGWRTLHNEELHNLYLLPRIIRMNRSRRMRWTRSEEESQKRQLGRLRCRLVYNTKMDLKEIDRMGWYGLD